MTDSTQLPGARFVPARSAPLEGTASAANAIARVHYSHDAMIDLMIAQPGITQNAIAKHFGYTVGWVSRLVNSDAFLARLAARKSDLVDPSISLSIEENLRAVANRSSAILLEKLETTQNAELALKALDMTTRALGFGARQANVAVQQNFVVALPAKAADAQTWADKHSAPPGLAQMVQEVQDVTPKEG